MRELRVGAGAKGWSLVGPSVVNDTPHPPVVTPSRCPLAFRETMALLHYISYRYKDTVQPSAVILIFCPPARETPCSGG
jgi:hypothetical protein